MPSFSSLPTVHSNNMSSPRKRQRSESSVEISQGPKRQSSHPPAAYWDNLSKIWLTTKSLRELDRRNRSTPRYYHTESKKERGHLQFAPEFLRDCSPTRLEEIKSLAESGGLDLTDLRDYPLPQTMGPRKPSSRVQKPQADPPLSETAGNTKTTTKTTATSAYSRNFEQNLIEYGVCPDGHEIKSKVFPEPNNMEEILEILAQPRDSPISKSDFLKLKRADVCASKEKDVTTSVISIIDGEIHDDPKCMGGGWPFSNLAPLTDGSIPAAKPDHHFGARPEDVNLGIRNELNQLIIPSTQTTLPICQNFLLEVQGPDGTAAVVTRQACYDGALAARAMQALRCYRQEPSYDNNAYTLTSTYIASRLDLYATYVAKSKRSDGRPEYIMTLIDSFSLKGNLKTCRQGRSAYRNARDWAKEKRDELIEAANERLAKAHSQHFSTPDLVSNMGNSSTAIRSARPGSFTEDPQRMSKRVRIRVSESSDMVSEGVSYPPSEGALKLDGDVRMG